MRVLEERFPTLYYDIRKETPARDVVTGFVGPVQTIKTMKSMPPTVRDVIKAVCSTYRIDDIALITDLSASVQQFYADKLKGESRNG
jgi:hypothetical protein